MKRRYIFFVFAICMISLVLPYHIGTAEEEEGPCPKPYIKAIFPRAGTPGEQVKIRGKRFGTEPGEVIFSNEVKAEILSWTMRIIWVIIPASSTSGPVVIRVQCGSESNKHYVTIKEQITKKHLSPV